MRFGVALDLWSKEELEGGQVPAEPKIPADKAKHFADLLNKATAEDRKAWLARFQVKPADLPLTLLPAAEDWLSDLEAAS
jgi:hypothetical protein